MPETNNTTKPELLLTVNLLDYESVIGAKEVIASTLASLSPKPQGDPIDVLELTIRSSNCLMSEGIYTLEQLCKLNDQSLKAIPNLGPKSREEIKLALCNIGLRIKGRYEQ